ncbi:MAG: hypothetical protein A2X08_09445 [Bacteroidetes bacterium GWA2_32_17]|nr:MAG: hypothetical protein A2X08_09445 [Bacteroidetes bacterium GWA2_32_17]
MKIIITIISLMLFVNITFSQTSTLDNENGTSMIPIVDGLEATIKAVENEKAEIVRMEFDLIFKDASKDSQRWLFPDYTYGLMVWGDYRIKKMAINVYKQSADGGWDFVSTGENKDFISTVYITPTEKALYKFEIIAPEYFEGYKAGHYGMLLLHN